MSLPSAATIIAGYAAFVGTLSLGWQAYGILRDRMWLHVKAHFGLMSDSTGLSEGVIRLNKRVILLEAANAGRRPVTLATAGLRTHNGRDLLPAPEVLGRLPYELTEGKSCTLWFDLEQAKEAVKEHGFPKQAWFRDATGRLDTGKVEKNVRVALLGTIAD